MERIIRTRTRVKPNAQSTAETAQPEFTKLLPRGLQVKVELADMSAVIANPRNPRTHSDKQVTKIAASIRRFGFLNPLLVDASGMILAGHGRLEAAKKLGIEQVPIIRVNHLTPSEKRAYAIADNRLGELSGWDEDLLKLEVIDLMDFDLSLVDLTGFETPELDILIDGPLVNRKKEDPADQLPVVEEQAVSRRGDIWLLGEHRLICGDARERDDFERLMDGEKADVVFTDPPYNVRVDGHVSGLGKIKHREFACASGEMSKEEFVAFLSTVFKLQYDYARDGSLHFTCIDWAHLQELLAAGHSVYDELKNIIAWVKTNGGMGSFYRSQHELIPLWKKGKAAHINNIQLGSTGRYRTNVWTYAGANTFRRGRIEDLSAHPTVKPCALVVDALKDCSNTGDIVLDPFGGSGTTMMAAEQARRRARLIEFDPLYVDLAVRRFRSRFKGRVVLLETGEGFDDVATRRAGEVCDVR